MTGMAYRALNCRSSFGIANKDGGTGRCRLTSEQFKSLSIQIGWIIRIVLSFPNSDHTTEVLCTAWPDSINQIQTLICIDDSIQIDHGRGLIAADWIECNCKITEVYSPSNCISIRVALGTYSDYLERKGHTDGRNDDEGGYKRNNSSRLFHAGAFSGLPVTAGVIIRAAGRARPYDAVVSSVNSVGGVSLVHLGSIVFPSDLLRPSSNIVNLDAETSCLSDAKSRVVGNRSSSNDASCSINNSSSSSSSNIDISSHRRCMVDRDDVDDRPVSSTAVVDELVSRLVSPSLHLTPTVLLRGVLLLGPPGVGKTFAVRALQTVCKDTCTIHIKELNIPDMLAAADPLSVLKKLLKPSQARNSPKQGCTSRGKDPVLETPSKGTASVPSSSLSFFSSSSPATPKVHPSSATSSSSPTPMAGMSTPSTPYKWNLGPSPSALKTPAATPAIGTPSSSSSLFSPRATKIECAAGGVGVPETVLPEMTIVVIDELDALGLPENHSVAQAAIKQYLCDWFDKQSSSSYSAHNYCIVATSNRPADVDPRLRRGGRLEREIDVVGSKGDRTKLLLALLDALWARSGHSLGGRVVHREDLEAISDLMADRTGGYVAADVTALVAEVSRHILALPHTADPSPDPAAAINDSTPRTQTPSSSSDTDVKSAAVVYLEELFELGMQAVAPSCLRGLAMQLPNLSYDDVIGCVGVKKCLRRILSFSSPAMKSRVGKFGLKFPGGALLYGPPGNSKTRLILAAAAHHGLPVISLSSADVYSPYVGDAEAEIRKAFRVARQASPCVLFLDELDALVTDRANSAGSGSGVSVEARVLATLLVEMDGISNGSDRDREGEGADDNVIVMAATNRIDCIDAALLRKGRFSQTIFVPLPSLQEKELLLRYFAARCRLSPEDIHTLLASPAYNKMGMSGADVEIICKEFFMSNIRQSSSVEVAV